MILKGMFMKSRLLSDYNKVFWAAIAATAIIILPIMFANNGNLYLVGDYMSQQIPFIRECRRMLLSGEPFWQPVLLAVISDARSSDRYRAEHNLRIKARRCGTVLIHLP